MYRYTLYIIYARVYLYIIIVLPLFRKRISVSSGRCFHFFSRIYNTVRLNSQRLTLGPDLDTCTDDRA